MSEDKRQAFVEAFSKLKQRVLWKWETDSLPGQPKNMMLGKWLPQSDILGISPFYFTLITNSMELRTTREATNYVAT
jgi:glucuronosyltransferase